MGFDSAVLRAHGVSLEGVNLEDTLLAHHAVASHLPQNLAHVVATYCDSAPWKLTHRGGGADEKGLAPSELPPEELARYNASDARLTALAWRRMRADLAPEARVYEHDKRLAAICTEMTYDGIGVDEPRRRDLSLACKYRRAGLRGVMRRLLGRRFRDFDPGRLGDVRRALFTTLRGPARFAAPTPTGLPSTADATLEAFRGDDTRLGRFAEALLQWRLVGKIRSTYLDALRVLDLGEGPRVHYAWKAFGTVSGRLACRLQSCPRYSPDLPEGRVREVYVPRRGCEFVYFDVSQAEMRLAAYLSADPAFMKACGRDVHQGNAKAVFPEVDAKGWLDGDALKDPLRGKPYRDISKNLGFAIAYGAEVDKVFITLRSKGFPVTRRQVEVILAKLHAAYRVYYTYVEENVLRVRREGYMRTALLGRIRWFGRWPKPTDVANYPIQSALADVMNERTIELRERLPRGARIVAQVHDAMIVEVPRRDASRVETTIRDQWAVPVPLPGGPLTLPIDMKRGERWSEL